MDLEGLRGLSNPD